MGDGCRRFRIRESCRRAPLTLSERPIVRSYCPAHSLGREALYGIASRQSGDIDDWSLSREVAEEKLRQALADEPEWADVLYVAEVQLESEPN